MNRDNVIRMAREAGLDSLSLNEAANFVKLQRFAQLVAAHERERCIEAVWQQERYGSGREYRVGLQMAANAIRARGTA